MNKQYDVFISYGRKDYEIEYKENGETIKKLIPNNPILQIVEALKEANITCWYDQDGVSSDFLKYIKQKIDSSRVMIFVSSQYSNQSEYTPDEIARAKQLRMPIIPFKIDKTDFNEDFALGLASKNTIDIFMTNPKKALADLVKCVQKSIEQVHKKEQEQYRKKQEEERRAKEEQEKIERNNLRVRELEKNKTKLQEIQKQLLKARNQCKELEQEERILIEAIKRLEFKPKIVKRDHIAVPLILASLLLLGAIIGWFIIPHETELSVATHEILCSHRDTSVYVGVLSNKEWFVYPSEGDIFNASRQTDSTMQINIYANKDSVARVDHIAVITKDRKRRETIKVHQTPAPKPIVQFMANPYVESNIIQNEQRGAIIHVKLSTKHLQDISCVLTARFYSSDGKAIKSDSEVYSSNGNLVSEIIELTPLHEMSKETYSLFIPYSELKGKCQDKCYFFVHVYIKSSKQELATSPILEMTL